jgi:hypothetical protein
MGTACCPRPDLSRHSAAGLAFQERHHLPGASVRIEPCCELPYEQGHLFGEDLRQLQAQAPLASGGAGCAGGQHSCADLGARSGAPREPVTDEHPEGLRRRGQCCAGVIPCDQPLLPERILAPPAQLGNHRQLVGQGAQRRLDRGIGAPREPVTDEHPEGLRRRGQCCAVLAGARRRGSARSCGALAASEPASRSGIICQVPRFGSSRAVSSHTSHRRAPRRPSAPRSMLRGTGRSPTARICSQPIPRSKRRLAASEPASRSGIICQVPRFGSSRAVSSHTSRATSSEPWVLLVAPARICRGTAPPA